MRLDAPILAKLDEIVKSESRKRNFLVRYAMQKFLLDYDKEGLRQDVLARLI